MEMRVVSKQPKKPGMKTDSTTHTAEGAPKDEAHRKEGDGTLSGAVPAGLTAEQLREQAESDKTDNSGTG
ncbi:hypothetical protein [Plastoroseomonas hellenica]|uniref:hypothetical protein n=1 Tax=Plastoroseomonas hellenica TaxID=2687306 RepID=UPI001BAB930B|nr:hypothetical protein [Plastoroseomonas hellenica]MBR0646465.1 hypothetical protein [Plastoroseomonas hellenica]